MILPISAVSFVEITALRTIAFLFTTWTGELKPAAIIKVARVSTPLRCRSYLCHTERWQKNVNTGRLFEGRGDAQRRT